MSELHDLPPEPSVEGELFLDFGNTLELESGRPVDHVGDARTLRAWLAGRSLLGARTGDRAVERELASFRELRELVRRVTAAVAGGARPAAADVRELNRVLRRGVHYHRIELGPDGAGFTVRQVGDELDQARAAIAGSLAHYLADHDPQRLRVCANEGCRWLFVDRSPAGRRRWCDMRICGNRAKVARHRARSRGDASARKGAPAATT